MPLYSQPAAGLQLTTSLPTDLDVGPAAVGGAVDAAHADHRHAITTAAAAALTASQGSSVGTSAALARADHGHDTTALVGNADSRLSNDRPASGIRTAGGIVDLASGAAPAAGSLLAASTSAAASFVTPSSLGIIRGPASSTTGNLASFSDASGDWISDTGIAASSVVLTSDARIAQIQGQQKWYRSALPTITNALCITNTAYWIFVGRNGPSPTIATRVFCWMVGAGTGTAAGEIAIATTPAPPNRANQTVTCLGVANNAAMTTSWTASALTVHQNTAAFATPFPAGAYCWLGIRTQCTTAQPSIWGICYDLGQGQVLTTAAPGVLAANATYTGVVTNPTTATQGTGWVAPDLQLSLV